MESSLVEIVRKINALGLWERLLPCTFAIKPRGTVFPYFCTTLRGERPGLRFRLLLLEGWQTFHDFLHWQADRFFGVISLPQELPHFELLVRQDGALNVVRYDTGYLPQEVGKEAAPLVAKLLWETYGLLLRLEADPQLPMRFAAEQAVFARVERANGEWADEPLAVVPPRHYVEQVQLKAEALRKAADLPLAGDEAVAVDFQLQPTTYNFRPRPQVCYELSIVDCATKRDIFRQRTAIPPELGLKGMWEALPTCVLDAVLKHGRVPGRMLCVSPRVFRFLRPLCVELPIRLSLHDRLD